MIRNAPSLKHALIESAKIHASTKHVATMQFALIKFTELFALVGRIPRGTLIITVNPTSVLWMQTVQLLSNVRMKNVWTHASVLDMLIAMPEITGASATASPNTLGTLMALPVNPVRTAHFSIGYMTFLLLFYLFSPRTNC